MCADLMKRAEEVMKKAEAREEAESSGSESEEKYARFAESGRWIAEMAESRSERRRPQEGSVPGRRCRILEVVIVRRLITWVLEIWRGEGLGKGLGKRRSVYKQPETKVDGSCHSYEGFQVSRRGAKGIQQGEIKSKGIAPCIFNLYSCT